MNNTENRLRVLQIYPETIVDGFGIRYSIYLSGCKHHCPGCQNPESWNPQAGEILEKSMVDEIIRTICENPILDGVTFSGGDPFYNPDAFFYLLKRIKEETKKNIWCYTGYCYEELLENPDLKKLLPYIDVLVDGRFEQENYSPYLKFRGSSNQRIINMKNLEIIK